MNRKKFISDEHVQLRRVLRVVGPILLITGIIILIRHFMNPFGFDPFTDDGFRNPLRNFIIGGFLTLIGLGMTQFAYMGAIARYKAREMSPVAKDAFNYVADEGKEGVKQVAKAIHAGLKESSADQGEIGVICPQCEIVNEGDARFCKACGSTLPEKRFCPQCGEEVALDARFCDHCGTSLED
ncbi:zinc ribbon domain-containing protein [Rubeoparvulum massiliense]|uniref:zinc ribbon domain-containing protein n=1 Tax=Rubeoparvulum massiliense TaxID=1631346 RepID=UPI00065E3EA0|nr:zinc ribbon domain-containing protein [Rubeoparvulum massiliense]